MKKCNHIFEMVFPLEDMRNQLCKCMICGKQEKRALPVINVIEENIMEGDKVVHRPKLEVADD